MCALFHASDREGGGVGKLASRDPQAESQSIVEEVVDDEDVEGTVCALTERVRLTAVRWLVFMMDEYGRCDGIWMGIKCPLNVLE